MCHYIEWGDMSCRGWCVYTFGNVIELKSRRPGGTQSKRIGMSGQVIVNKYFYTLEFKIGG